MSDNMAGQIKNNMLSQLRLDDVVDNKGVLLVGNYGTGKSHLMSVISAIALDKANLTHLRNQSFAKDAEVIAGRFHVIRIEFGAVTTPLREIILNKVQKDFKARGLTYNYPSADSVTGNKDTLRDMMEIFASKYPGKGYLIVVDEFLNFLGGKDDHAVRLDLGFMRELGKIIKESTLRVSDTLWKELAVWAEEDFRSINGQIEYLLTECVRWRKKNRIPESEQK
ncbi:MAG: DUF6079 family protein [Clostridiales bacterium]|jgi:hypothetical protein|nr:DUF6079 family protein [Clostridiales bacterium]